MANEKWMVESILYLLEHQGGGSGTSNYNDLRNKPKIEGVTLEGDVSLENIGAATLADLEKKIEKVDDSLPLKIGRDDTGLYMET